MKMCALNSDDDFEDEFETTIRQRRTLIEKGRKEEGASFWNYVGLIGAVGWAVVVPMLAGIAAGLFLDKKTGGGYAWTLGLLLTGLCMGCFNGWRIINKERH